MKARGSNLKEGMRFSYTVCCSIAAWLQVAMSRDASDITRVAVKRRAPWFTSAALRDSPFGAPMFPRAP
jgi:hypothetical protein